MDDSPDLEDGFYFEKQLEKNIKTENMPKKMNTPIPKNQIVLPKL